MNKRRAHILLSWLLLIFFAVGQVVVYTHQHHTKANTLIVHTHGADQQIVHEKCNLCGQMHHAPIYLVQPLNYVHLLNPIVRLYIPPAHYYKANALVHADGLSPPALV